MPTRFRSMAVIALSQILLLIHVAAVTQAAPFKAGAAKINITPQQFFWMAGYGGRSKPAEGKLTDLWAKALVLEDARGRRVALITLDLVGIERSLSQSVCGEIENRYGLARSQVAICTSHTHTGPVVGRNLAPLHYLLIDPQQQQLVDQYAAALEKNIVAVVGRAIEKLEPARLSWGSGRATFAVNRRNNPAADVPRLRVEGNLKGPRDHDVPVLAVSGTKGKLKAVAFGYACHATVLSLYQWSGDYPGYAQIALEKMHPGSVALFWAGCGADQNPLPRREIELAQQYGARLAVAVDQVLRSKNMAPIVGNFTASYREIDLPLARLPSRGQIEQDTQSKNKYTAARARMLLEQIDSGQPLSPTYPYPVQLWRLGRDVRFVTLGGEVVVDYALRLKAELDDKNTWVAGYSNDVMAYIPSRRVLREGGYEGGGAMVYYGLPTVWDPAVENNIIDEVHRQLKLASGKDPVSSN